MEKEILEIGSLQDPTHVTFLSHTIEPQGNSGQLLAV